LSAPVPIPYGNSTRYQWWRVDQGDTANSRFRIVGFFTSYQAAQTAYGLDDTMAITFPELVGNDEYFVIRGAYTHVDVSGPSQYGRLYSSFYEADFIQNFFFHKV
jgi:hypothetical protein